MRATRCIARGLWAGWGFAVACAGVVIVCSFAVACGDASHEEAPVDTATVGAPAMPSRCADAGAMAPGISDAATPEEALEAYARWRTGNCVEVQGTRRGEPFTIEYQIK